jgi:hypothetical protein
LRWTPSRVSVFSRASFPAITEVSGSSAQGCSLNFWTSQFALPPRPLLSLEKPRPSTSVKQHLQQRVSLIVRTEINSSTAQSTASPFLSRQLNLFLRPVSLIIQTT